MTEWESKAQKFPRKFGKYHLLSPLAQGGMGALYLGVTGDKGLEKLIAIKTVLPHLADKEYVARFRDEAKVVVQLSHANLVPVFDAGQAEGELFMAMDFVEGKDLRAVWNRCAKKGVAFPVDVAAAVLKELCRGLGYAHSYRNLDLVHRDVSPPNLLISYSGEVKLTDFGLASSTLKLEKTAPGIVYGKVAYMSPEQAQGEPLDGRSDMYAAGIIFWELLTGRQLFPPGKEQPKDLARRAKAPEVPAPSSRAPRVPKELDDICLRALASRPEDRYASCDEFRKELSKWLAKNAPEMDTNNLSEFMHRLFGEDIVAEQAQRKELLERTRQRIRTLPPTHELRRLLDSKQTLHATAGEGQARGKDRRAHGRRMDDQVSERPGRRSGARPAEKTTPGLAVSHLAPVAHEFSATRPVTVDGAAAAVAVAAAAVVADEGGAVHRKAGELLDGRYRVVRLIGEGGMGLVYLAEHVEIGKQFAVKILHKVYGRMPDLVERFRREARAASRIGHPHIVDVTDSGTTADGAVYFVMEFLDGVELAEVIDREGALDIPRTLRIVTQICRALSAAHEAGIIHRDLKPENVYLTVREATSDFVKVLDFGIAKSTEADEARTKRLTHPGMAMGTPEYMAPEQAAGRPADHRCDVYAVGAILYEMLTGVAPYEGENFMEILTKKATVEPRPMRELRAQIPSALDAVVMQAMSRDPDDRPSSMDALEYELEKCLGGRGAAVAKVLGLKRPGGAGSPRGSERDSARRTAQTNALLGGRSGGEAVHVEPFATVDVPVQRIGRRRLGAVGWMAILGALGGVGIVAGISMTGDEIEGGGKRAGGPISTVGDPGAMESSGAGTPEPAQLPGGEGTAAVGTVAASKVAASDPVDDGAGKPKKTESSNPSKPKTEAGRRRSGNSRGSRRGGKIRSEAQAKGLLAEAAELWKAKQWSEARRLYEKVSESKFPSMRRLALTELAKREFERGNFSSSQRIARMALQDGAGVPARRVLARALFRKKRYSESREQWKLVLKKKSSDREALNMIESINKVERQQ